MKHITAELEAKIRNRIEVYKMHVESCVEHRKKDKEKRKLWRSIAADESESNAYGMVEALEWVLRETGCNG